MRLTAEMWVAAYMRRAETEGAAAYLRRRGAAQGGSVALKILRTGLPPHEPAATALARVSSLDGGIAWSWLVGPEPALEREVDAKLERQAAFDPDLWLVEIEDREGRRFLDDPILG
ncbi:MAG: DUF1491 family protein [Pseudomonadota bacterium]